MQMQTGEIFVLVSIGKIHWVVVKNVKKMKIYIFVILLNYNNVFCWELYVHVLTWKLFFGYVYILFDSSKSAMTLSM